jgi:hypothetical protein
MANRKLKVFIIASLFILHGCSVTTEVLRSKPIYKGEVIEDGYLKSDAVDIYVRSNNEVVKSRTSKVIVEIHNEAILEKQTSEPHSFNIAVKSNIIDKLFWNPYSSNLIYGDKLILASKVMSENLIFLDKPCKKNIGNNLNSIELSTEEYVCLKVEYLINVINPNEEFDFIFSDFVTNSQKLADIKLTFVRRKHLMETRN